MTLLRAAFAGAFCLFSFFGLTVSAATVADCTNSNAFQDTTVDWESSYSTSSDTWRYATRYVYWPGCTEDSSGALRPYFDLAIYGEFKGINGDGIAAVSLGAGYPAQFYRTRFSEGIYATLSEYQQRLFPEPQQFTMDFIPLSDYSNSFNLILPNGFTVYAESKILDPNGGCTDALDGGTGTGNAYIAQYCLTLGPSGYKQGLPSPVPLPAALPLLLASLGGLCFCGRRNKKAV